MQPVMAIGLKLSSTLVLHKEGMNGEPFTFVGLILRAGAVLLVANEVRGLILAGPNSMQCTKPVVP